jgi:hypothetical protein
MGVACTFSTRTLHCSEPRPPNKPHSAAEWSHLRSWLLPWCTPQAQHSHGNLRWSDALQQHRIQPHMLQRLAVSATESTRPIVAPPHKHVQVKELVCMADQGWAGMPDPSEQLTLLTQPIATANKVRFSALRQTWLGYPSQILHVLSCHRQAQEWMNDCKLL